MDRTLFWEMMDASRTTSGRDVKRQEQILQGMLEQLPLEEIISFDHHFSTAYNQAYRPDVRAAAWLTLPACNDTDFQDFAMWVVTQGQGFHATLCAHPEQLDDLLNQVFAPEIELDPYAEHFGYVATAAYQTRTGEEQLPDIPFDVPQLWGWDFRTEAESSLLMPELWQKENRLPIHGLDFSYEQWLACDDMVPLLTFIYRRGRIQGRRSSFERKMRWFACACCRRIWDLLSESSGQQAVIVAERFAACQAAIAELYRAYESQKSVKRSVPVLSGALYEAVLTALFAPSPHYSETIRAAVHSVRVLTEDSSHPERIRQQETAFQIAALRDLFGDLFYSGTLQLHWVLANGAAVRRLAEAIDEERAFERLPVLADALEEAGCTEPMILEHCRDGGMHVRGCWVIDLLLRSPGMVPEVSAWPFGDGESPSSS